MTKQRQLIYETLQNSCKHLTAEEIYFAAKKEMPSLALGTVYRNLNIMADEGLIRRIEMTDGPVRFDRTAVKHDHIVCKCCGKIKDISDLTNTLKDATGVDIISYDCCIYYICEECKKNNKNKETTK